MEDIENALRMVNFIYTHLAIYGAAVFKIESIARQFTLGRIGNMDLPTLKECDQLRWMGSVSDSNNFGGKLGNTYTNPPW